MPKRILIVGTGSIGERHVRCFSSLPGVKVSICELDSQLLAEVAAKYGVEHAFGDWNAVPLDGFYAVVLCTPAHLHVAMIRRALEHSCHVLCEKPLAVDLEGIPELIEFAEQSDRVTAVAYVWRANSAIQAIKQIVDSGILGEIRQVTAFWGQEFSRYRPAYHKVYYKDHKTGGGALQDAVTHNINFIEWFMGPCKAVFCAADHLVLPNVKVEDTVSLTFTFKNSPAIGTLALNQFQKPDQGSLELIGTKTNARFDYVKWSVEVFDPKTRTWGGKCYPVIDRDEMFITQANMFLEGAEAGIPQPCQLSDAFATLKTIKSAFRSWRSKRMIAIDD